MSDDAWEEAELRVDQAEEVLHILAHTNDPVPLTSVDISDAINTAFQPQPEGMGLVPWSNLPEYPYVGDFAPPPQGDKK